MINPIENNMQIKRNKDDNRTDAKMSKSVQFSNLVFLSGQVADKTRGKDTFEQTAEVLEIIENILNSSSSSKNNILHAMVHLTKDASFNGMNDAWNIFIDDGNEPSRTTVEAELYAPDCLVEITVIATK